MFFLFFTLNFAGGYREVEIPSPIPNLEVKHFIADNTAGSPGGNVGRCQLLSFYIKLFSIRTFSSSLRKKLFFQLHFFTCSPLISLFFYLSLNNACLSKLIQFFLHSRKYSNSFYFACIAPMVEQFHGKEEVIGSTPIVSTTFSLFRTFTLWVLICYSSLYSLYLTYGRFLIITQQANILIFDILISYVYYLFGI